MYWNSMIALINEITLMTFHTKYAYSEHRMAVVTALNHLIEVNA